jgi:hypothetical protein
VPARASSTLSPNRQLTSSTPTSSSSRESTGKHSARRSAWQQASSIPSERGRYREASKKSKHKRNDSVPTCPWCPFRTLRLQVVRYLVSAPIRTHGLGHTAYRAWSSVASADAPLAYELSTALAFGGHRVSVFRLAKWELPDNALANSFLSSVAPGLSVLQQENGEQHQAQAWEQPGIPVSTFFNYLRSPARSHATLTPVVDQFEIKVRAEQWLRRGVTEV